MKRFSFSLPFIIIVCIIFLTAAFMFTNHPEAIAEVTKAVQVQKEIWTEPHDSVQSEIQNGIKPDFEGIEIPLCKGTGSNVPDDGHSHEIITHSGYTLCYREEYEQPEWVAYELDTEKLVKAAERQNNFRSDPAVSTDSATPDDYRKSGYDRGHLAPAADMAYDEKIMSESFFMSNMSPQLPAFNRGIWKYLEEEVRRFAERFDKIYIVTGPVLEKDEYPVIGSNNVAIPEYYYKVIYAPAGKDGKPEMIAFILPNEKSGESFWNYATTVDEVEQRTGIDFFHILDDTIENAMEAECNTDSWNGKE